MRAGRGFRDQLVQWLPRCGPWELVRNTRSRALPSPPEAKALRSICTIRQGDVSETKLKFQNCSYCASFSPQPILWFKKRNSRQIEWFNQDYRANTPLKEVHTWAGRLLLAPICHRCGNEMEPRASALIKGSVLLRLRAGWWEAGGFDFVPADNATGCILGLGWMTTYWDDVKGLWEMDR